ncbi:MAG: sulfurtransferase TusA family protein [Methanobacteriota archaeon]|nr:MAG: sulfurtransferase TusA family protein [Euryarchaeota archaeon]
MTEDETLDLCGEKCPDTFVYSKIKLEELAYSGGGVLKIIVDYPPAAENIPRSLRTEKIKYEVLEVRPVGDRFELLVRAPAVKE